MSLSSSTSAPSRCHMRYSSASDRPRVPVEDVFPDPNVSPGHTQPTTRIWEPGIRFHRGAHCCLQTRTKQEIYECRVTHVADPRIPLSNPHYWRLLSPRPSAALDVPSPHAHPNDPQTRHHAYASHPTPSSSFPYSPSQSQPFASHSYSSAQPYSSASQPTPIPSARRSSTSASTHARPDVSILAKEAHRGHRPSSMMSYSYGGDPGQATYSSGTATAVGYDPRADGRGQYAPAASAQAYAPAPAHGGDYPYSYQDQPPSDLAYGSHGRPPYGQY